MTSPTQAMSEDIAEWAYVGVGVLAIIAALIYIAIDGGKPKKPPKYRNLKE